MSDLISRQAAIDAVNKICDRCGEHKKYDGVMCGACYLDGMTDIIEDLPSAQPEPSEITDEQAILHLQSTGWMQNHDREMYESGLREQLADDSGSYDSLIPSGDTILRKAAIDAFEDTTFTKNEIQRRLSELPSAQSDIIRCNACKHWTQTTGNMPGFGLGDCDYLNAKLVSCNGFCYWAERRTDG